jgi:outer membrane protein assembly factor BamB
MKRNLLLGLVLNAAVMAAPFEGVWPQWRGPTRDGNSAARNWPDRLDEKSLQQRWRLELGPSYSGPIVTTDKVFTTETRDGKFEVVRALERATGKEVWKAEWPGSMKVPFFARSNGDWIRSTPAWDGDKLFVGGMRDVLVCLDSATGVERWRHDFPAELKTEVPTFGFVCSPLVDGDALYVQAGGGVMRLDKESGKIRWRSMVDGGGMDGSAFSSPVLATLAGKRQLVVQSRTHLAGIDLDDGKELWSTAVEAFRGMNILTPTIVSSNRVFTSTYGGKTLAFDITSQEGRFGATPAWTFKAQGYMTSPILLDGHAYLHLRSQRALCIDVATGTEKWTSSQGFGKYWSMVAGTDRILSLDERGILYLIRATPEKFEIMSERKVADDTWAHLAVAGNQLFIRELRALAAYDWVKSVD